MQQLSEQELTTKITTFLEGRFSKYPELSEITVPEASTHIHKNVVSRVKGFTKRITTTQVKAHAQYQS